MGMPTIENSVVKPPVGSKAHPPFLGKSLPAVCEIAEEEKGEWLVIDKTREKLRTAGPQSLKPPTGKET